MDEMKILERKWLERKKRKEYYDTHKDQYRIAHKKWSEKNKEILKIKRKKWYAKNKEKVAEKVRIYYTTHPEARKRRAESARKWQKENSERLKLYSKKYAQEHPEKRIVSKTTVGIQCFCGFCIKSHSRNSAKRKIKCPCCHKSYFPCDMKKITIQRDSYRSVYDIEKEKADKKEFEELIHKRFIEKGLLSA